MRLTSRPIVIFAAALLETLQLTAQVPDILESKVERHEGPPLWISAESVADEEKIVNLDLVGSDSLRRRVEKQRRDLGDDSRIEKGDSSGKPEVARISSAECKSETYSEDTRAGAPSVSLRDLVAQSNSIIRGTVRAVELGFSFGVPSSLLEVEILEVIAGPPPKSPLYIDYPVARFKIGPYSFCNANKGFEPRPGDQVVLFAVGVPMDRGEVLFAPRMDQVFFQRQGEALALPPNLRNTEDLKAVTSLSDVLGLLRSREYSHPKVGEQ